MHRRLLFGSTVLFLLLQTIPAVAQTPMPYPAPPAVSPGGGPALAPTYTEPLLNAGAGVQLYPYDQQDPWLHGYFQRYPAYGGYSSFRPYNYKHVYSQSQVAAQWGSPHGMPYSQQFWNRYRGSYMEGMLHDTAPNASGNAPGAPLSPFPGTVNPIGYRRSTTAAAPATRRR